MKISLVVSFAVLATLMQLQLTVSAAENSSSSTLAQSSNSSTLIRRKRWSWFWDDAVPSVSIVLNDAVTKIQFGVETIMNGAKEVYNTGKNALFGSISYDKGEATDVVTDVSNACREALALTDTRSPEDDVDFNLEIIDTYINQNFEDDNLLKVNLEEKHPELTDVVMFSKKGFECNEEFCTKFGDGVYAFGICSPYSCSCSLSAGAEGKICPENLIYDPMYEICDDPLKIKICGF